MIGERHDSIRLNIWLDQFNLNLDRFDLVCIICNATNCIRMVVTSLTKKSWDGNLNYETYQHHSEQSRKLATNCSQETH